MHLLAIILLVSKKSALRWLVHLGSPGLILLGLADNSLIPLPGSTDVVTILLAAHHRNLWVYSGYGAWRDCRLAHDSDPSQNQQNDNDEKGQSHSTGWAITPTPTVRPPWQDTQKCQNQNHDQ